MVYYYHTEYNGTFPDKKYYEQPNQYLIPQLTIMQNKTSILWTPGSQVYLSKKKKLFGQQKQIKTNA